MKKNIISICIGVAMMVIVPESVFAARLYIDAPKTASSNKGDFVLSVFIDHDQDIVSGISGDLSFPSDLFTLKIISTQNGMVPLWVIPPHLSMEKTLDGRTHILFEGIIPGGFSGVYTPYNENVYPGVVFSVILIPSGRGQGELTLSNVELHAYDSNGTLITRQGDTKRVSVPQLTGKEIVSLENLRNVISTSITMEVATSSLVNNAAPYVYVRDEDPSRSIDHIEIAETDEYNPAYVSARDWHIVDNPHILTYSSRTKYIHAKVIYTDHTYAFKTIEPVENSHSFLEQSRILVYIVIAIFLLYHYGKNFLHFLPKNLTKHL